jgi:hypothetical protein
MASRYSAFIFASRVSSILDAGGWGVPGSWAVSARAPPAAGSMDVKAAMIIKERIISSNALCFVIYHRIAKLAAVFVSEPMVENRGFRPGFSILVRILFTNHAI